MSASRGLRLLAALAVVALPLGGAASAHAASVGVGMDGTDGTAIGGIAHVEATKGEVRVLVNVPESADPRLDGVGLTLDGQSLDATARQAGTDTVVQRTTVLAIDTSDSMAGDRFDAAQDAARTFIDTAPADVRIGIVTFDDDVTTALGPTLDRQQALDVVDGLTLAKKTHLYDGVLTALDDAGQDGERSVLVISDGADTSDTEIGTVTDAINKAGATVQVVALDQSGDDLDALSELADAGDGSVVQADPKALAEAFSDEADVLARQVLVTAPLPDGTSGSQATVAVDLPTSTGDVSGSALVALKGSAGGSDTDADTDVAQPTPVAAPAWEAPRWLMFAGGGAVAVGLFVAIAMLAPGKERPLTADERVAAYAEATRRMKNPGAHASTGQSVAATLPTALDAASGVLERNRSLEDKIASRLTAAGSALKPSEWLLVHVGIFVLSGFVGFILGGGSIWLGLFFLVGGALLPRLWLTFRAGRRRKAFGKLLPDTLQLMSGSLAAGLSLMQSVDTIVREGQEPVRSEFKRVLVETRLGVSLEDSLDGISARFDSQDWAWVVMAIRIQRTVGGNLSELLETVGITIREREFLRRQVAALSAEGKLSAYILGGLPPGIFVFLYFTNRQFVAPLFETGLGIAMVVGATLWLSVGVFWMSRMIKVEV